MLAWVRTETHNGRGEHAAAEKGPTGKQSAAIEIAAITSGRFNSGTPAPNPI